MLSYHNTIAKFAQGFIGKPLLLSVVFIFVTTSLSCQSAVEVAQTQAASRASTGMTTIHFPQPWGDPVDPFNLIEQLEVRKAPNAAGEEFFFAALPDGDFDYAYEVDKIKPEPRYSQNSFAVNFSTASSVHVATREEWQNASRIATKPRYVFPLNPNDSSGEIEYKHRHYPKVGKYWGNGLLPPSG